MNTTLCICICVCIYIYIYVYIYTCQGLPDAVVMNYLRTTRGKQTTFELQNVADSYFNADVKQQATYELQESLRHIVFLNFNVEIIIRNILPHHCSRRTRRGAAGRSRCTGCPRRCLRILLLFSSLLYFYNFSYSFIILGFCVFFVALDVRVDACNVT